MSWSIQWWSIQFQGCFTWPLGSYCNFFMMALMMQLKMVHYGALSPLQPPHTLVGWYCTFCLPHFTTRYVCSRLIYDAPTQFWSCVLLLQYFHALKLYPSDESLCPKCPPCPKTDFEWPKEIKIQPIPQTWKKNRVSQFLMGLIWIDLGFCVNLPFVFFASNTDNSFE